MPARLLISGALTTFTRKNVGLERGARYGILIGQGGNRDREFEGTQVHLSLGLALRAEQVVDCTGSLGRLDDRVSYYFFGLLLVINQVNGDDGDGGYNNMLLFEIYFNYYNTLKNKSLLFNTFKQELSSSTATSKEQFVVTLISINITMLIYAML